MFCRIIHSDDAKEYCSTAFPAFLSSCGIVHQSSCPCSLQQNGVAKRKYHLLIETAHNLLLHMHVPISFWDATILTSCYLIIQTPTSVPNGSIPHTLVFTRETICPLPPYIFGPTCFVHLLSTGP